MATAARAGINKLRLLLNARQPGNRALGNYNNGGASPTSHQSQMAVSCYVLPSSLMPVQSCHSDSGNRRTPTNGSGSSSSSGSPTSSGTSSSIYALCASLSLLGSGSGSGGGDKKSSWWCPKCGDPCAHVDTFVCTHRNCVTVIALFIFSCKICEV